MAGRSMPGPGNLSEKWPQIQRQGPKFALGLSRAHSPDTFPRFNSKALPGPRAQNPIKMTPEKGSFDKTCFCCLHIIGFIN